MSNRTLSHVLMLLASIVAAPFAAGQAIAQQAPQRPNIIFIFTDDHATHAIGAYGSKINKTPHIDRIAAEGMRFDYCLVTNSICGPSRACILTGKYSHKNGFYRNGNNFDGSQWTFPKALQKAGYQTAMIGKWHLSSDPTGFDHWEVLYGQGPYYNPPMKSERGRTQYTGYTTHITTGMALTWLDEQRDKSKPFMLMYQHKAPHRNWQPGPDYLTMYDDVEIPEPATLFDDYAGRGTAARQQEMTIARHMNADDLKLTPPGNLTPEQRAKWDAAYEPKNEAFRRANLQGKDLVRWKYQRYVKDYLRCVAAVDDDIGKLLAYLDESGLAKNTVVIYSSDQGWYLGDHGWYDKRWMYEESLRMPMVVRWPGVIKPGSVNKDMVSNVDFAATFLEMAGAENPGDLQGKSLVPIMKGRTPDDWRKSFYYHYYEFPGVHAVAKHYGVRTERHKLIHFYQLKEWELYDLEKDPDELTSVYDDPAYADVVTQLKAELKRLQTELDEPNPEAPVPGDPGTAAAAPRPRPFTVGRRQSRYASGEGVLRLGGAAVRPANDKPDLAGRPLVVGGWIKPAADSGVVMAQGGASLGFSLYLHQGVATFAVRNQDVLRKVSAPRALPLGEWSHVVGVLDGEQRLRLYVNGEEAASAPGHAVASVPLDVLSIGADTGSLVSDDYNAANAFRGEARDLKYDVGPIDARALKAWASEE